MTTENAIDNEGWTTIVKKKIKNKNPTNLPLKFTYKWNDVITKKDTTLTREEQELINREKMIHPDLGLFCKCCQPGFISDIICRSFFECGRCYCCAGDDPSYDDDEWFENCVHRRGIFHKYNKDYHYKKDEDFYENY